MTLRTRVLAVALAAMAALALMGMQVVLRYGEVSQSVDRVVDTIAPANAALSDLDNDVNNMDRRLRLYVSTGDSGYRLLQAASVGSAQRNLAELGALLAGRPRYVRLVAEVSDTLERWLAVVSEPVQAAMAADDPGAAQEVLDSRRAQTAYQELVSDTYRFTQLLAAEESLALEDTREAARRLAWSLGFALVLSLLIPIGSYVALRHHVLAPITQLRTQLRRSATPGQHDSVIVPDGPPELRDLGSDAEALRRALVREIDQSAAATEALEQEGPVVAAIRHELAARPDPGTERVHISGALRAAEGVLAGDFWDRITLPDGRAAVLVCDVSGHGPRAGIVAMRLKTAITLGLLSGQTMPQILHRACDAFADEPGRFATVAMVIADPRTGGLEWINAGHPAPRVVRATGAVERLEPTGPMVSWLVGTWTTGTSSLGSADVVLAFTDGILESRDPAGQELGDDALDAWLRRATGASDDPAEITELVLADVRDRAEDLGRDDVTFVALRIDPVPGPREEQVRS